MSNPESRVLRRARVEFYRMPDKNGRFLGISVPDVPWQKPRDEKEPAETPRTPSLRRRVRRGSEKVEIDSAPERETR